MPTFLTEVSHTITAQVEVEAETAEAAADLVERHDYPLPPREEWQGSKDWRVVVYGGNGEDVLVDRER